MNIREKKLFVMNYNILWIIRKLKMSYDLLYLKNCNHQRIMLFSKLSALWTYLQITSMIWKILPQIPLFIDHCFSQIVANRNKCPLLSWTNTIYDLYNISWNLIKIMRRLCPLLCCCLLFVITTNISSYLGKFYLSYS